MKKTLLYLMVLLPALGFGQTAPYDFEWTGTNWVPSDPSGQENSNLDILIREGNTAEIHANGPRQNTFVDSVVVEPGGQLRVTDDAQLQVATSFRAMADGNSYSQVIGDISGPGNSCYYQIYLNAAPNDTGRWYNLAFPVIGARADSIMGVPIQITGDGGTTNLWYYFGDTTTAGQGEFRPVTETFLDPTRGYQVFAGDDSLWGNSPFTVTVVGASFPTEPLSIPPAVEQSGVGTSWNLLPNPYPAILDWQAVYDTNTATVGATYYVQGGEPDTNFEESNDNVSWHTYSAAYGGNGNTADSTNEARRYIAPGMSFFIEYDASAGQDIRISEHMLEMEPANEPPHFKTTTQYEQFALNVEHMGNGLSDMTYLMFDDSFDDQKNIRIDGTKIMNSGYPNLYTRVNQDDLVYNGLNDQFTTRTVDLHFQGDYDGTYELSLADDAFPTSWTLELEDKLTGNKENLRNTTYTFNHVNTNDEDRFLLHIKKGTTDMEEVDTENMFSYMQDQTLNVSMEGVENATVRVYNVTGQLMVEESDVNDFFETATDDWASGVYLIEVESANGSQVYEDKVVKTSR